MSTFGKAMVVEGSAPGALEVRAARAEGTLAPRLELVEVLLPSGGRLRLTREDAARLRDALAAELGDSA